MEKIQILLLDNEMEYVNALFFYLSTSRYQQKIHIQHFSKFDLFLNEIETTTVPMLIVVAEHFFTLFNKSETLYSHKLIYLSNQLKEMDNTENVEQSEACVYRYQPFDKIFEYLISVSQYDAVSQKITSKKKIHPYPHIQVISFYSTVGHCGKTLMCVSLAKQLSLLGKKVFLLNLEELSALSQLLSWPDNQNFANLMYYLRNSPDRVDLKYEQFVMRDPLFGIDYLSPSIDYRDLQLLKHEDLSNLLLVLQQKGFYDYLLIDLPSAIYPWVSDSLSLSQQVFWLLVDDFNCFSKTGKRYETVQFQGDIHFIMNKFTGRMLNDYSSIGIEIAGYLPYIPEWKSVSQSNSIMHHDYFHHQVWQVFWEKNRNSVHKEEDFHRPEFNQTITRNY